MPDPHIRSAYKREQKKTTRYCKITGSKPPLDFQRSAHCSPAAARLWFPLSLQWLRYFASDTKPATPFPTVRSVIRSVLPGKCSIIRKITRDVEEPGHGRYSLADIPPTDRNDPLELAVFFIRSEEIDLSWDATLSRIEIPSFLFPLPRLEFRLDENQLFIIL